MCYNIYMECNALCNFSAGLFLVRQDFVSEKILASVAQLDRASDSDSEGRRFDSCQAHQWETNAFAFVFAFAANILSG